MSFGITFTAKNILNRDGRLTEVTAELGRINRTAALEWCVEHSRRNHLLLAAHVSWQNTKAEFEGLINAIMPPEHHQRARQVFGEAGFISPFSEDGLVALIGMVCRYCAVSGGDCLDGVEGRWRLFQVLLAFQGLILPEELLEPMSTAQGQQLKKLLKAQFPYVTRVTLSAICQQNRWSYDLGRLHAIVTVPDVGASLAAKCKGMTVADWFEKRLGIPSGDYEVIANVHFGAATYSADFEVLPTQSPSLAPSIQKLLAPSAVTPEEIVQSMPPPSSLLEVINHAEPLLIRPLLRNENRYLVTSLSNFFNKFHRGLPYLALEARKITSGDSKADSRAEFGAIFQGYIFWLVTQWFKGSSVQVITEYWTRGYGLLDPKGEPYEKDLLLIADGTAYVFEIKASVPSLGLRRGGDIADYKEAFKEVTIQAYQAAQALTGERAYYDRELTKPIPSVEQVYPCAIGYGFNPLRFPYSDFFQEALEFDLKCSVFRRFSKIGPMQYFDVQQIEMWDDLFDLPAQAAQLFDAIRRRADDVLLRNEPSLPDAKFRPDYQSRPGIVRSMTDRAEKETSNRLKGLTLSRSAWPKTFKEAFCDRFNCPPERYEERVFWRCLHRHAIPVAILIHWINPEVFREDFDLIHEIGGMNDPLLFRGELDYFHGRNVRHDGWLRRYLRMRVSGRRMLKLKDALFSDVPQ